MSKKPTYNELLDSFEDQRLLIEIGRDLMRERDVDRLLRRILEVSRLMTGADAGSIFLAEDRDGKAMLRFKYSHTVSMQLPYEEFVMPRTVGSVAGYVSLTGHTLNIPDAYALSEDLPYSFNKSFDMAHGYRTRSMLVVPMTDHTGAVVGVIQLLNSKELPQSFGADPDKIFLRTPDDFERLIVPFKSRYEPLMEAVAAQAAIALENASMIKRILGQFEQFVAAAVDAVEARDPATSGHSFRVAVNAVALARLLNAHDLAAERVPRFSDAALKELEYAALLHDFGKVYIDPSIFLKSKKLFPGDFERLKLRLKYLRRSLELDFALRKSSMDENARERLDEERERTLHELVEVSRLIETLNEPSMVAEDPSSLIARIRAAAIPLVRGIDDEPIPLLTEEETANLLIKRGSLNESERAEIERHVVRSYEFVKRIPWPPEYARLPEYVKAHHEMLDGSGYPDRLSGEQIPLQARLLAVADVYDALTASDRPYKKSASPERAVSILTEEAIRGKLDGEIVDLMRKLVLESNTATP
jgi:HD-GYP domain-containing protein (c-di-GMP phosphodiesterase class II)